MISHEASSAFHAELPRDLAQAVSGLGAPLSLHRTSPRINFRRGWWGSFILIAGIIANIWFWFFAPHQRIVVLLAVIGIPISGLALWLALIRDRGIWVMRYPMGLLRWQRGEIISLPWEEIVGLTLHGVARSYPYCGTCDKSGQPATGWIPLDPVAERILGPTIRLYRNDGFFADIPASLTEFLELSKEIQEEVFRQLWPSVWQEFIEGKRIRFGIFVARNDGLFFAGSRLRWGLAEDAMIAGGQLQIRAKGFWKPWADAPLDRVLNPHLLLALFLIADDIVMPNSPIDRETFDV